jgi:hypothetical protein
MMHEAFASSQNFKIVFVAGGNILKRLPAKRIILVARGNVLKKTVPQ